MLCSYKILTRMALEVVNCRHYRIRVGNPTTDQKSVSAGSGDET